MTEALLNDVYEQIRSNQIFAGMEKLVHGLREIRLNCTQEEWSSFVSSVLLTHPLREIVHEDPFTFRAYAKPRGYPGDAVLLDLIYQHWAIDIQALSEMGKKIYDYTSNTPGARAVRFRRLFVAQMVEEVCETVDKPSILSVACGHLREIELLNSATKFAIGKFIGMDHDNDSLQVVKRDYKDLDVFTLDYSVRDLLRERNGFKDFDLIYSCGLYDYLESKVAKKLTSKLFGFLSRGGVLITANFLPAAHGVGYMESYMGWFLKYRNEAQMIELIEDIPRNEIDRIELFVEREENIVFLKLHKST